MKIVDLTGQRFGRLVVCHRVENTPHGKGKWMCKCECGKEKPILGSLLRGGMVKSCSCLRDETTRRRSKTHGMAGTPEYYIWGGIVARCCDMNSASYDRYGGRGISICKNWRKSFMSFYKDMGARPSANHSIDRKNNDRGYCKSNCKWATKKEQARNRRNNTNMTYKGNTKCLSEWCEIYNLTPSAIFGRRKRGWSIHKTLTTPIGIFGKLIKYNGRYDTISGWSRRSGLSVRTIGYRLDAGWPMYKVFSIPSVKCKPKVIK